MLRTKEQRSRAEDFGGDILPAIDLNKATAAELAAHPLISRALAAKVTTGRGDRRLSGAAELLHAGVITAEELRILEQVAYGRTSVHPLITRITCSGDPLYVKEPFALIVEFSTPHLVSPEFVTLDVRFPSGTSRRALYRVEDKAGVDGRFVLDGFESAQPGELSVLVTLRDSDARVHQASARFAVFTRNPVQMIVSPSHLTASGSTGAPKFDFGVRRWDCICDVRWVNSEDRAVDLGRQVTVEMTDAGAPIGTFSFNVTGAVVVPARSTVYGTLVTFHAEGGASFNVFHAKGDLTFRYTMSGSGFSPTSTLIWRTMRVVGYNVIRVGDFTAMERSEYERAARNVASGIYQSRDMTVHDVELYRIEGTPALDADKARFRFIDSQAEINALRSAYTVNNWYLDVFFVEGRWDGAFGSSPNGGPVDKNGDQSGIVIRRDGDTVNLGQTFAHEGGHYLGLAHADEDDGCADTDPSDPDISDNFIFSSSRADSTVITGCQIDTMRRHGLVRALTP